MAHVTLGSARTGHLDPDKAADELLAGLPAGNPKLVTVFASRARDHVALNRALRDRLGRGVPLAGASTGGEIDNDGLHQDSVVIGALYGDLDVAVGLGKGLSTNAIEAGTQAMSAACQALGKRPRDLDPERYVGLVIDDGLRWKKEELLLGILEQNQALVVVGGGACDTVLDPAKQCGLLHANDEVTTDSVLVALIRTDAPWAALRSHNYLPTGETLTITKLDETQRRVLEIDDKPAAARYAELVGCSIDELSGKRGLIQRPTARKVGREYFIQGAMSALPDGSMVFMNLLQEGTELELMKRGDLVGLTAQFFEKEVPRRVQNPTALLAFNCMGRYMWSQMYSETDALSRTFKAAPPCAGMNVCFETYCSFFIQGTLTALAFGSA